MATMNELIPTIRDDLRRRSRLPFWLLVAAILEVCGVIVVISAGHGRALTPTEVRLSMIILTTSVPMLLAAVLLSQRVTCPSCKAVLGFKTRVQSCPSCRVRFDGPMPSKLVS